MTDQVSPVEFGRVLGHLESIQGEIRDLKSRVTFRVDNLEDRVEKLEREAAGSNVYMQVVEKLTWGLIVAGAGVVGWNWLVA